MPSCGGPGRSGSDRHGRASKGGSPWIYSTRRFDARRDDSSDAIACCSSSRCSSRSLVVLSARVAQRTARRRSGSARNGDLVSSRDGDIYAVDRATRSAERRRRPARPFDFGPTFSRDGTKLVFLRASAMRRRRTDGLMLSVANADGIGVRPRDTTDPSLDWFDWSPDGSGSPTCRAHGRPVTSINVVDVDRSGLPTLDVGRRQFTSRGCRPMARRSSSAANGRSATAPPIFAIAPDGTGSRASCRRTPATIEFDYQGDRRCRRTARTSRSPAGPRIADVRCSVTPRCTLDLETGSEIAVPDPRPGPVIAVRGLTRRTADCVGYLRAYPSRSAFQLVVATGRLGQ